MPFVKVPNPLKVNGRVFMAGKPDVADFARLFGCRQRLECAAFREEAVRVLHADVLVILHKVHVIRLEAA